MLLPFLLLLIGTHRAKTKLFESVDGKIAAHKDVLKTRADVLVEVKAGLIANGKALA